MKSSKKNKKISILKKFTILLILILLILIFILIVFIKKQYSKENTQFKSEIYVEEKNDKIISITSNIRKAYLAVNGTKKLEVTLETEGNPDTNLNWESSDDSIVSVDNEGIVYAHNVGNANIKVYKDNAEYNFEIIVTDLITVPTLNNDKPELPCGRYTKEEADLLDEILFSRVEEAGYGTRGGVVAAIRFLLLEFPYTIRYFNENGRLSGNGIGGEGRYYERGLYLHKSKFETLKGKSTFSGPAIWGCTLYDSFIDKWRPNGFTCSGFVTWALLNGGLDIGDVGAGDYAYLTNELSDMGPHIELTYDFMRNGQYKVGDFVGRDGHAALIIGISDTTIYTAEALPIKTKVWIYERYSGIVEDENLTYLINMDDIYPNGEGIYTNMW